jgi:hypothetical protein
MFDIDQVSSALSRNASRVIGAPGHTRAAVALILAGPADDAGLRM